MKLEVAREAIEAMAAEAALASPREACGLLLGEEGRVLEARPAANVAEDPERRFEIDPRALIDAHRAERAGGLRLLGYYHSHPSGPAEPSAIDRAQASGDGRIWAIVAGEDLHFWRDLPGGFKALSYTPGEG